MPGGFANYRNEIYPHGLSGSKPRISTDFAALEEAASQTLPAEVFDYVAGGAGSGATMRANQEALDRWKIVPRMLTGVTNRDLTTTVLGTELPAPVLLAPVGGQSMLHPDAELATARAASSLGVPMIVSTVASHTVEEVAEAGGDGPRWFQLYWPNDPEVCASILGRARAAGYSALVVTVDTPTLGWRPRDLDHGYVPYLAGHRPATPLSDPAFRSRLDKTPEEDPAAALLLWSSMQSGSDFTWEQLAVLRERWDGPIVLKGILHVDDARRAADAGMDGVVVSNHGGRQVDGVIGALDALPPIAQAVGSRIEVYFDSGVRTGSDVIKALALGAKAVLLGRPYAYGLAQGGEDGVRHVVRSLLADLDTTLRLTGHGTPSELSQAALHRA